MKLYELSDKLVELEDTIENLEGISIPADLHQEYMSILAEANHLKADFTEKVDSILSLIQTRKKWLEIRKEEAERLKTLVRRDEKAIEWLQEYLKEHLEKIGVTKFRTNKFNVSVRKASIAPLKLKIEDAEKYPKVYQRITIELDKKALREDLKTNPSLSKYCELGERKSYLSIK
ncbi:MAG: hypothetical protein D6822_01865 [Cyanobacteria bacterium J149]|nr:MAG: hypothetical protein D6822_01865 [Cyanobacteria bacterium J149]